MASMVSYTWSCDLNGEVASPVSINSAHRSRSSLMFPADILAHWYKKSAVLNCTPYTNGYQGVSGKGCGGGGVPRGREFQLGSHGKTCHIVSLSMMKNLN